MIRTGRQLLAVAAILIASGCGGGSSQNPFKTGTGSIRVAPPVEVTNNNWLDAVVYATRLGSRIRIGEVTSMSQRVLQVPPGFAGADGSIGIQVTLIGSGEHFLTDQLYVSPDEMIVVAIQNHMSTSSWAIFPR